ncbi:MAG: hypothetical protein ABJK37_13755 [Paraglaciecola sp.]|uniref:hypothetical protein n=1 Tax=Paraglaciecola sp. TaxID=1920173 RepID=UPI003299C91E
MSDKEANFEKKVLIIRMLNTAEVVSIGLPAIRFFQQGVPDAEIHFLTFSQGGKLISIAEPSVTVHCLPAEQWPDNFFLAMESFLGLAEQIIAQQYSQIVNLDTAFMPCFLSRFLKDALEPVSGNYLNTSVKQLLSQVEDQSLQADYVNSADSYLASSFMGMYKWQHNSWHYAPMPDGGYPEYYLSHCCGLDVSNVPVTIKVTPDKRLRKEAKTSKVVALCLSQSDDDYVYPHTVELKKALQALGYYVWLESEAKEDLTTLLKMLATSDLMIAKPSALRWYAQSVDCATLLITAGANPAIYMPDFATDATERCLRHGQSESPSRLSETQPCSCDLPQDLAESVSSIFEHLAEEQ